MTMPVLVQNVRNRELESALKKSSSVIAQALNMYLAENGAPVTEGLAIHQLKPAIIKYFNVIEDCGLGFDDADSACIKNYGDADKNSSTYKNYNGTSAINLSFFDDGQFVLTDGTLILIENQVTSRTYISVDVNGYNKRPNRLGQDLFMFQLFDDGSLTPMGAKGTYFYSENDSYCSKTSSNPSNGAGCTYKALSDPSFWKSLP